MNNVAVVSDVAAVLPSLLRQLLLLLLLCLPGDDYEMKIHGTRNAALILIMSFQWKMGAFGFVFQLNAVAFFMVSAVCNSYLYYLHNIRIECKFL